MGKSKIIFGGETLIDLTGDSATKDKVLKGFTFHDNKGELQTGECEFDVNSQDATALVAEVLEGDTFYARGQKLTGTMPNRGAVSGAISDINEQYTIQQGYHDGSGKVGISANEKAKAKPENIRKGVTLLGVKGSMSGDESVNAQSVEVTPTVDAQTILPGSGYTHLSQVLVKGIPYVETPNSAGGITVTIG